MRKKIIAANWKMYGTQQSVVLLTKAIVNIHPRGDIIIFPPYPFIPMVAELLRETGLCLGGQNVAAERIGAFTGEVSATMLVEFGCRYVLVGHSERRQLFHETDDIVAKKFAMAQQANLIPLLCLGETHMERKEGNTFKVILAQLDAVLELVGIIGLQSAMIAYEPVWAIGSGVTATPAQAQEVHVKIREHIAKIDVKIADSITILYGGSINADNASALFIMPDIDGGLVGGASLDVTAFAKICKAINVRK